MKWDKEKGSIYEALSVASILLFLFLLFGIGIFLPLRKQYSVEEKRELKKFPKISVAGILKGSYFQEIASWYQDSYPGKEEWLNLDGKVKGLYGLQGEVLYGDGKKEKESIPEEGEVAETFSVKEQEESTEELTGETAGVRSNEAGEKTADKEGKAHSEKEKEAEAQEKPSSEKKPNFETDAEGNLEIQKADTDVELTGETAGSVYLSGKEAFELYYFSEKGVRSYASLLNTVKSLYPDLEVSTIMVPNSFGVLLDSKTQEKLASSGMDQAISYTYSLMNKKIHTIDVFSSLYEHRKEYIYFRTDHHWTQLGAYYAYREYCKSRGISAFSLDKFTKAEYGGFYGTFYFYMKHARKIRTV